MKVTDTEQKALALVHEAIVADELRILPQYVDKALLCEALHLAIEQHEQFKREVSDAVEEFKDCNPHFHSALLSRFIMPKPVDPLVEALIKGGIVNHSAAEMAADLRAAIETRGGKIVWENEP